MSKNIHAAITSQILDAMEQSDGYVQLPWHRFSTRPVNVSGRAYHGINVLCLWVAALKLGYASNQWGTYKQWLQAGGQVRKGEKSSLVVFYKMMERNEVNEKTGEEETHTWPLARFSWVFNRAQVDIEDGPWQIELVDRVFNLPAVDQFIANTGAKIQEGGARAFYRPATDSIYMPERRLFFGSPNMDPTEAWYAVLLHELTHWTAPEPRCNRTLGKRFGDQAYAMEELVAEIGSAFLCADLSISPVFREDHAHYLKSWVTALQEDERAIFIAAQAAEKAAEFLKEQQSLITTEAAWTEVLLQAS